MDLSTRHKGTSVSAVGASDAAAELEGLHGTATGYFGRAPEDHVRVFGGDGEGWGGGGC